MQVVLSTTLSRLYRVMRDFYKCPPTPCCKTFYFTSFPISTLVPLALHLPMKSHLRSG